MKKYLTFVAGLAAVVTLVCAGCRNSGSNGTNNSNDNANNNVNTNTGDNTIYQTQDPGHPQALQVDDPVRFEEVVITALDTYGARTGNILVEEPGAGAYSGVMLFDPSVVGGTIDDLAVGDLVNVTGTIDEFALATDTSGRTVTEIINATVELLGQTTPITPEVVGAQQVMQDPTAEEWEGVLVTINNVRATAIDTGFGEVTFTGGLVASDELYDVLTDAQVDTCYAEVTGVMNYFFNYFIMPRGPFDLVVGQDTDCDNVTPEDCTNGIDDDGDSFIDCADFDCSGDPTCRETECADGLDNDSDGFIDCNDFDCLGTPACPADTENDDVLCQDGQDNDNDGLLDCEDPSCHGHPLVTVCVETNCTDGVDDDLDTFTDCADFDCLADAGCAAQTETDTECTDGIDNDGDGDIDCADIDCRLTNLVACTETDCTDGSDDDGDGFIDCADFDCQFAGQCPGYDADDTTCVDGIDNDNNGFTDCDDWGCTRSPTVTVCNDVSEGNDITCSDGLDNDGNGFTDCDDFDCRDCSPPSIRVVSVCPPCP